MMQEYVEKHPKVNMHEAFDIIRGQADKAYLDSVTRYCEDSSYDAQNDY
jgi:hypothetical protein